MVSSVDLIAALNERLGADIVSTEETDLSDHAQDAFGPHRPGSPASRGIARPPLAVVRPRETSQVSRLLRLANELGFAVVPYGGGTGLMGGAAPISPAVSLSLRSMCAVREVRPADFLVWAEAGATPAEVDDALRPHGLMLAHDPWTYRIATVGGTISTNGLGYLGGRYGGMGDQTLAVEVVLPNGEVVRTRPVGRHSTGLDLKQLFIGTEGTMGVVTAAALHAHPIPEERIIRGYAFASFEAGLEAVAALAQIALRPALLDFGESSPPLDGGPGAGAQMYVGFEGFREGALAETRRADRTFRDLGATRTGDDDARAFWDQRHAIADRFLERREARSNEPPFSQPPNTRSDFLHLALPASKVAPYWRAARDLCREEGVAVREAGLWCTGELFSLAIGKTAESPDAAAEGLSRASDRLLRLVLDHGGSMEYCHGVGVRLAHLMEVEHGTAGLDAMRAIKRALDPRDVLNPGKLGL